MYFIGDVHGYFDGYRNILNKIGDNSSIQVGDFGYISRDNFQVEVNNNHKFIRGNHDNPEICKKHPNYLGEFGYLEEEDIFFVSGAQSIDRSHRYVGVNWWEDEELPYNVLLDVIQAYKKAKPRIVVTHCAPIDFKPCKNDFKSRTEASLQVMFEHHYPEYWICGHYHKRLSQQIESTKFEFLGKVDGCEEINYNIEDSFIKID